MYYYYDWFRMPTRPRNRRLIELETTVVWVYYNAQRPYSEQKEHTVRCNRELAYSLENQTLWMNKLESTKGRMRVNNHLVVGVAPTQNSKSGW